ncbi:MAG: phosphatidate cytidylyltransferase [Deltaproteobacteria bacterium]|nr:phosphatidate cytidylyltransferase [Deltaproteobacteria bacterium]
MHSKRLITGLVALPFLLLLIFKWGIGIFALTIGLVCLIALWEYFRIVFNDTEYTVSHPIVLAAFVCGPAMIWAAADSQPGVVFLILALNIIACGLISVLRFKDDPKLPQIIAWQVLGMSYIPLFLACLVLIRNTTEGVAWTFTVIAVIFMGDTGAYYAGRQYGKRKLCPSVSPGKTVEGALGGLATNVLVGIICKFVFALSLPWVGVIPFFMVIGAAGQLGDLFESIFKRSANIKDSGNILPGHGGILDRIDALLFALPVAYGLIHYMNH